MSMTLKEYTQQELAAQPIGAWTGVASRLVVGALREQLAVENLTQPHWWTLNHVAGEPGRWTRAALTERLKQWDDLGIDFDEVFDDLVGRGWLTEDAGLMTLTGAGEDGRIRAKERNLRVHRQTHEGIETADFVTTINVLRRMVANLGGDGDLPT
ncbi:MULTISPECIES: MarR family transcriptional regulator [unclassified Streptomyces]|uniref:MarR family transcriptional regulator n=1 Tax=unclassified Streptomyces TaxID=2593676 RepID=UPI002E2ACFDF|nr:MarR family transcriptional regulator [Streptomyces sp. NBC_01423]WSX95010.1 MarR family transcriptional regulator [Streptomyces sp. NBC_00891]WSY09490.1 MarR family transcriptional regulator [Streptomyces sp. NBC_00890]WSZ11111.1 MarR family transcriptional regulator [Streptomyces sp. NBC_00869]WSZ21384.1 MarR family transcriptional regulator [Streptomyces sp. NBC_00870]